MGIVLVEDSSRLGQTRVVQISLLCLLLLQILNEERQLVQVSGRAASAHEQGFGVAVGPGSAALAVVLLARTPLLLRSTLQRSVRSHDLLGINCLLAQPARDGGKAVREDLVQLLVSRGSKVLNDDKGFAFIWALGLLSSLVLPPLGSSHLNLFGDAEFALLDLSPLALHVAGP